MVLPVVVGYFELHVAAVVIRYAMMFLVIVDYIVSEVLGYVLLLVARLIVHIHVVNVVECRL